MEPLDFIGIASTKCGTSWIAECLKEHPEVYMPKKEFKYFDSPKYKPDLTGFKEFFAEVPEGKISGEFTPRYFINRQALERIKEHFPNTKTILVFRNPLDRAVSQYKYYIYNVKRENLYSFSKVLQTENEYHYSHKSLYAHYIKQVYEIFPKENVHVILYDDIQKNPEGVMRELYRYLGIDENFVPAALNKKINVTKEEAELPPHMLLSLNKLRKKKEVIDNKLLHLLVRAVTKGYSTTLPLQSKLGLSKNNNKVVVEPEALDYLYDNYFKKDIEDLEKIAGIDLTQWKRQ